MNWGLRSTFDKSLTNDGMTATLTAYAATNVPTVPTSGGYMSVTLHVLFKNAVDAEARGPFLRQPFRRLSATEFIASVEKKAMDVAAFENYLRERHDAVVRRW